MCCKPFLFICTSTYITIVHEIKCPAREDVPVIKSHINYNIFLVYLNLYTVYYIYYKDVWHLWGEPSKEVKECDEYNIHVYIILSLRDC